MEFLSIFHTAEILWFQFPHFILYCPSWRLSGCRAGLYEQRPNYNPWLWVRILTADWVSGSKPEAWDVWKRVVASRDRRWRAAVTGDGMLLSALLYSLGGKWRRIRFSAGSHRGKCSHTLQRHGVEAATARCSLHPRWSTKQSLQ